MKDSISSGDTFLAVATSPILSPFSKYCGALIAMVNSDYLYRQFKEFTVDTPERYLVTAALPYANGPIHLGHLAGAYLPPDIYVRYLRLKGEDVVFVCGSDEHGAAITIQAKKEGTTPQEIVDKYHELNKQTFADFGIDFDIYHRTSSELHHETAADFFTALNDQGAFVEQESEQYYDEEFDQFLADRYIKGQCPNCDHEDAYGDQCENCGKSLSPLDLIDPISTLSGKKPELKRTRHWFLPLNQHQDWLKDWISTGQLDGKQQHDPNAWKKNVIGQCLSWIKDGDGLQPRSITRDLDWGVKVPLAGTEGKVLYVWLDAPIGYISATKQWAIDNGRDWKPYWMSDQTKLVHFIGKDNIVFHCIIFPVILKTHGSFVLPDNVPANEFLNLEGRKLSTSRNWAVWLHEYLRDVPDRKDELRYVINSISPESKDSEFTWKDYQARVNNELVAILGNFVNRAVVLTHKYYEGLIPEAQLSDGEYSFNESIAGYYDNVGTHIEKYQFRQALAEGMNLARAGNKFLADTEPWKLFKAEQYDETATVLNHALQIAGHLATLLKPFLPDTCDKLERMLGLEKDRAWGQERLELLAAGHRINSAELLFERIEDELVEQQIGKLKQGPKIPIKDMIKFEDFEKLDIRVGAIASADKHENADKLLVLKVDFGDHQRTIVSGIAEHYDPAQLVGQQVTVLLNLEPRKIRGIESEGMVLMAENEGGALQLLTPKEETDLGSIVR